MCAVRRDSSNTVLHPDQRIPFTTVKHEFQPTTTKYLPTWAQTPKNWYSLTDRLSPKQSRVPSHS